MPTAAVPTPDEIWKILKEAAATLDRTDQLQERNSREIAELRLSQKETDKQLKEAKDLFTTQWGRLMEILTKRDLVPLMNQQGIPVTRTATNLRRRGEGDNYEYDIIAEDLKDAVVVMVRTTLEMDSVKDFLEDLRKFTSRQPIYKKHNKTVYGAVAWLEAEEGAEVYAEKQGLFVIRATGSSGSIVNKENFKPQIFS